MKTGSAPVIAIHVLAAQRNTVVPRPVVHREIRHAERLGWRRHRWTSANGHLVLAGRQFGGGDAADRMIGGHPNTQFDHDRSLWGSVPLLSCPHGAMTAWAKGN